MPVLFGLIGLPISKRECGATPRGQSAAAPATVSGECLSEKPLSPHGEGKGDRGHDPQARRPAEHGMENQPSGRAARRNRLTPQTRAPVGSSRLAPVMALLIGLGIVTLAGHVQASALHDAAHDVRHATGFPCH